MATSITIKGIILEKGTGKLLSGATIRLEPASSDGQSIQSDENGAFSFEVNLPEGQTDDLLLYAYKEGWEQRTPPEKVIPADEEPPYSVKIEMVNRGPVSNMAGGIFLGVLIALLVGLSLWYYDLHKNTFKGQDKVNHNIVNALTESLVNRITADSIRVSAFEVNEDTISSKDSTFAIAELQQIRDAANELLIASKVDTSFQALIKRDIVGIQLAINRKRKGDIQKALIATKAHIKKVPTLGPSWFWKTSPLIYGEVLFWALFATLIRLIGNTSYYVSRNVFYRDSILHKAPLLFTIPLITLLIVFVISFFKIAVSVGGNNFTIDFSNPFVSIILASLVGLAPWKAWEFMYGLADLLFNQLKKWLGINKSGDVQSEGKETESKPATTKKNGEEESDNE